MSKFIYKNMTPFKWFVLENFPFIENDFEAINNYRLFSKVVEYLNKTIDNVNVLGNLVEQFSDYFDNLDVQEEINNKLDEMAEAGTLQEIIAAYLNSKAVFGFDTVNDMKQATNLINGSYAKTLGYYSKNDGGSGLYKIRTRNFNDTIDNGSIILMNDETLVAELIIDDIINVKQFGAKGDGITDDTVTIQNAINNASLKVYSYQPNNRAGIGFEPIIYFPTGKYVISNTLNLNSKYIYIEGNNSIITSNNEDLTLLLVKDKGYDHYIENLQFIGGYNQIEYDDNTNLDHSKITINNCKFWIAKNYSIKINDQSCLATINNCYFYQNRHIYESTMIDNTVFNKCWFSDGEISNNNDYTFKLLSGLNTFNNCMFIPNGINQVSDLYNDTCWIENHAMITVNNCRVSNEKGAKVLINNYAKLDFDTTTQALGQNTNYGVINIVNNPMITTYTQAPLIKLFEMPRSIIIENNNFYSNDFKFIDFANDFNLSDFINSGFGTGGELSSYINYTINYIIKNNAVKNHIPYYNIPINLAQFIKCDRDLYYTFSNNIMEIPFINQSIGNNLITKNNYLIKGEYRPDENTNSVSSFIGILGFNIQDSGKITVKFELVKSFQGGNVNTQAQAINITPTFKTNNNNQIQMASQTYKDLSILLTINAPFNTGINYTFKQL